MTKRIFRSILGVSLAVLLASLVLIVGVLHGYFQDRVSGELESLAEYIAHGVEENGTDYLTEDLPGSYRITWVDADGTVLFDNRQDPEEMGNHAQREEIREALILGKGHAVRYSDTLSQQTLYAAQRLADGTVLRVSSAQYSVWVLVLQALQPVALMMLLAFILAMALASRVARQLVEPINAIDLNDPAGSETYEELTPLLSKLRSQQRQIQRQMRDLKRRQEEFTAITENMSEGFLVIDQETRVLTYNSAVLRLLYAQVPTEEGESVYALNREAGFRRCVEEALADMCSGIPMNRLVQGDVGSGKTMVAAACVYFVVKNGSQAALMAPTEILAQQHYETFFERFAPFGLEVEVLSRFRTPAQQKRALICALKDTGRTVAMIGDGVNDVLALKDADCSIAMAAGSEAAQHVAQLVLLDSDFAAMPKVVAEGRRVINNIQRASALYLVKNILSFFLALITLFAAFPYPFVPIQLTLISALTIGVPSFFLALEPNHSLVKGKFLSNVFRAALPGGLTDLFVVLGVEVFFLTFGFSEAELSTMSAILLIVIGIMVLYEVCKPFDWKRRVLWGAMAGSSAVTILGFGGSFGLSPLGTQAFLVLLVFLGLAYSIMRFMLGLFDQGERLLNRGRHLRKRR